MIPNSSPWNQDVATIWVHVLNKKLKGHGHEIYFFKFNYSNCFTNVFIIIMNVSSQGTNKGSRNVNWTRVMFGSF